MKKFLNLSKLLNSRLGQSIGLTSLAVLANQAAARTAQTNDIQTEIKEAGLPNSTIESNALSIEDTTDSALASTLQLELDALTSPMDNAESNLALDAGDADLIAVIDVAETAALANTSGNSTESIKAETTPANTGEEPEIPEEGTEKSGAALAVLSPLTTAVSGLFASAGIAAVAQNGSTGGITKTLTVIDGPIQNAKVYYDRNGDGRIDDNELLGQTNLNGQLTFQYTPATTGKFIVIPSDATTDALTGNGFALSMTLNDTGTSAPQVVSPLSSLIASGAITEEQLKAVLGLPDSLDIDTFNYLDAFQNGDTVNLAAAQKIAAANIGLANIIENALGLANGLGNEALTAKAYQTLAETLKAIPSGTSLADMTRIGSTLTAASVLDEAFNINTAISSLNGSPLTVSSLNQISLPADDSAKIKSLATQLGEISASLTELFESVTDAASFTEMIGAENALDQLEDAASDITDAVTPTTAPTEAPTTAPTSAPTEAPTTAPTTAPTEAPTTPPTSAPTEAPTTAPTTAPTQAPTLPPTQIVLTADTDSADGVTDGTVNLNYSLSGLAALGIDTVSAAANSGVGTVNIAGFGTNDFADLNTLSFSDALHVNLQLNSADDLLDGTTDGTVNLHTSLSSLSEMGIDTVSSAAGSGVTDIIIDGLGDIAQLQHVTNFSAFVPGHAQISTNTATLELHDISMLIEAGLSFVASADITFADALATGTMLADQGIDLSKLASLGIDHVDIGSAHFSIDSGIHATNNAPTDLASELTTLISKFEASAPPMFQSTDQVDLDLEYGNGGSINDLSSDLLNEIIAIGIDSINDIDLNDELAHRS